ncbi:MAG: type I-A CRISPR-associated protein Cas4/Csa1 [Halanaerobiales bacterium]
MYLYKGLIPESREMYIDEDLRGWNWQRPPLKPVYDFTLAVFEVAADYCSTARDLYLKKVMGVEQKVNKYMVRGSVLHETLKEFITGCREEFYGRPVDELRADLISLSREKLKDIMGTGNFSLEKEDREDLEMEIKSLWNFEKQRVIYRIQEILSRQPYIETDALLFQALPVIVEHKLNGSFLGLSPHLSTDAINFSESIVVDIKFGSQRDFHKLSVTGYALAMEAIHSFPVNIGCVVYPSFKGERILLDREFFIIGDEYRQKFIENRDERMRMIYQEDDPGKQKKCNQICPFFKKCH